MVCVRLQLLGVDITTISLCSVLPKGNLCVHTMRLMIHVPAEGLLELPRQALSTPLACEDAVRHTTPQSIFAFVQFGVPSDCR
jgi:hypothetical protein